MREERWGVEGGRGGVEGRGGGDEGRTGGVEEGEVGMRVVVEE